MHFFCSEMSKQYVFKTFVKYHCYRSKTFLTIVFLRGVYLQSPKPRTTDPIHDLTDL